ncbi:hypothetical protein CHLRE_17g738900v5 [Chlamydomonas reinhardtii]|uniref:Uncharacterized protein n=1 Tax=Chlamydomonas reinhardtii TaxID=3055 RepID=A8IR16_CHLRE|nr:uncharacterized protein CHLRE_17g738900v5 [Chlamydomonas reinhardtii]PNW70917.1 hypothetical protein CHLRE_17g738900v5 [Chlamydomonas reinhardtii]|eukprot:XP_001691523.1 predicted protein [Chlamydomonas reinhardtii]
MQRCAARPCKGSNRCRSAAVRVCGSAPGAGSARGPRTFPPGASRRLRHLPQRTRCQALGPGGGKGPQDGPIKRLAQQAERHAHQLLDCLTPKAEYDFADVFLIGFSTLVFMWVAAEMYRLYAFSYYASGAHTAGTFMGH